MKNYLLNLKSVFGYTGAWRDTVRCVYVSRLAAFFWLAIGNPGNRIEAW